MNREMKRILLFALCGLVSISTTVAQGVLYGKVVDSKSKEPLIGAVVGFGNTRVVTDQYGFYSLHFTANKKEVEVEYACVGYKTKTFSLQLVEDKPMNVELDEDLVVLPEVVVKATTTKREIGETHIPTSAINSTPALLAEADPIKVFQYLPSIQAANEGQSNSVIRGQAPETALLAIDGINIYNSNHAMGLLSTVNAEAVKDMTFYNGYQPASLGGKMGGVIKIQTKDGDMHNWKGNVSIGVISARANIEVPVIKDKLSISLAGRRSLIDLFIPLFQKESEDKTNFSFFDSNYKVTYKPNSRLSIALSGLLSGDKLWSQSEDKYKSKVNQQEWNWGTYGGSLSANYIVSPKWMSQVTFSASDFWRKEHVSIKEQDGKVPIEQKHKNDVSELNAHWSNRLYLDNHITLHTGLGAIYRQATIAQSDKVSFWEGNLSMDLFWKVTSWLRTQVGLRLEYPYPVFSPRVAISADVNSTINAEVTYSRTSQRMLTATTNSSILQSDIWFAPSSHFLPPISDQVGITLSSTPNDWLHYSIAGYYINMRRLTEYKEGFVRLDNYQQLPERVSVGRGYSYGVEALLGAKWQGIEANISYSYMQVRHLFSDINSGQWYRPYYDRPHRLVLYTSYQPNSKWLFSASWHYTSGSVQTVPLERFPIAIPYPNEPTHHIEQVSEKSNYRLPSYHRLDVAASYKHKGWTFALSVYNAYYRQNVYRAVIDIEEDGTKRVKGMTLLPIIPGLNIKYSF